MYMYTRSVLGKASQPAIIIIHLLANDPVLRVLSKIPG